MAFSVIRPPAYLTIQPGQVAEIDWANPINRGLSFAFDTVNRRDIVKGNFGSITGSKIVSTARFGGMRASGFGSTDGTGTTDKITFSASAYNQKDGPRTQAVWFYARTDGGGGFGRLITKPTVADQAGGSDGIAAGGTTSFRVWRYDSANTKLFEELVDVPTLSDLFGCLVVTHNGATGSGFNFYFNGQPTTSTAATAIIAGAADGEPLYIGNRPDLTRCWDGWIGPIMQWDRVLSAAEVSQITNNPWQILKTVKNIYIPSLNQRVPWQRQESTILGTSSTMGNKSAIVTSFKSVRTSQPQGFPIINWENSITDKLATAFIPSYGPNGRIFDAVTGLFDTGVGSTFGVGKLGYYNTPVSNVNIGNPSGRIPKYRPPSSYPGITTFTVFEFPTTGGSQYMLGGGVASTVYNRFLKNTDDSITYIYNSNTGGSISTSPLNLNTLYYAVGKQRFGTNYRELYVNKELIGVDISVQTNINTSYVFAGITTTGTGASTRIYCSYVWLRELSVGEIYSLTDNPWQIFRPPTRLIGGAR